MYDRILEMCVPMKMDGDSKREKLAANKIYEIKKYWIYRTIYSDEFIGMDKE